MSEKGEGPTDPDQFYREALTEAELVRLPGVRQVKGLDAEIELLRIRLLTCATKHPDDFDLLLKGMGMLVRAVATRYRLSADAKEDLESSLAGGAGGRRQEHGARRFRRG